MESDIGAILNGGDPYLATFGDVNNIVYGQDTANGPLVAGVGTLLMSDGPDPLGDSAWNDATRIFSGTYSSILPTFAFNVGLAFHNTDANTFAQVIVGMEALDADTTTVVRVQVPEPAAMVVAASALAGLIIVRRGK
jgi:hypothetical protein